MNIKADLGFFCYGDFDPNQHLQDLELDKYLKSPDRNDSFGALGPNSSERKDCMNKILRLGRLVCIKNMFFFIFPN